MIYPFVIKEEVKSKYVCLFVIYFGTVWSIFKSDYFLFFYQVSCDPWWIYLDIQKLMLLWRFEDIKSINWIGETVINKEVIVISVFFSLQLELWMEFVLSANWSAMSMN